MAGEQGSPPRISVREGLDLLWRSFFLQSVWNPRGMQNVGFCFTLLPIAGRCGPDRDARKAFLTRNLRFFNTNPTLASYAIGAAASAEAAGRPEAALDLKRSLSGPLGMSGDTLFWGTLRPLAGLVGIVLALSSVSWAPLGLLLVYNVPHLFFRARGIWAGASRGPASVREVAGSRLRRAVTWLRAGAACLAGYVVAAGTVSPGGVSPRRAACAGVVFLLAYAAGRIRVRAAPVAFAAALGAVLAMMNR